MPGNNVLFFCFKAQSFVVILVLIKVRFRLEILDKAVNSKGNLQKVIKYIGFKVERLILCLFFVE